MADGLNETILANTSNVGLGGLCVHLNQEVEAGVKVDIQLQFTNTTTLFKCQGTVVRCKQENERFYNLGIQFEPLSELKAAFLEGKISEIIALEQKGQG
jgi:hypothetical protein